jgi:hypothetical protein
MNPFTVILGFWKAGEPFFSKSVHDLQWPFVYKVSDSCSVSDYLKIKEW